MKSALVTSPGHIEIVDCPPPALRPDAVRVKVTAAGICGSDVHLFRGEHPFAVYPVTPGHEFTGVIVETNPGSAYAVGERVAVHPLWTCGECEECKRGRPNYCAELRVAGVNLPGAFTEEVIFPERTLRRLPPALDFVDGALVEPVAIACHVLKRAGFASGMSLAVVGSGTIGMLALELARARGAGKTFAVDRVQERVELALRLGADAGANNTHEDAVAAGLALAPKGFDVVLDLVCEDRTLDDAIRLARKGGVIVMVAMPRPGVVFDYVKLYRNELSLRGTRLCTDEFEEAIDLIANGRINARALVTHRLPLAEAPLAFDLAANHPETAVKVILEP